MAVSGAVLRTAYLQYSRIVAKQTLQTASKSLVQGRQSSVLNFIKTKQNSTLGSPRQFSTCIFHCTNTPVAELGEQAEWSIAKNTSISNDIVSNIEGKLGSADLGRLFAVIQVGGKQRKVTTEDIIIVEHIFPPTVGDKIRLEKVLMVGSKDFTMVGRPILSRDQVYVEATVVEKTLSHFKAVFNYIARKGHRRMELKRAHQTMLVINDIQVKKVEP